MKINEVIKNGIIYLNKYGILEANWKVKQLLEYELEVTHEYLAIHGEEEIEAGKLENWQKKLESLANGKPIQYITHSQAFYGLDFYVDENVLIPQPDTEVLVEEVLELTKNIDNKPRMLDICTGSGAIAISILKNRETEMVASDVSQKALEVAKKNLIKHALEAKLVQSNMFDKIEGKFDVIVSNPPYIETETIQHLSKEVQSEPQIALDGGKDGLDFYRILTNEARNYLVENGILAVEIGYNQKENVMNLFQKSGFSEVYARQDYGKNDRIVVGRWRK